MKLNLTRIILTETPLICINIFLFFFSVCFVVCLFVFEMEPHYVVLAILELTV